MRTGGKAGFASGHPVNLFFYFMVAVVCTMFTLHPFFVGISFLGALAYGVLLKGWAWLSGRLPWMGGIVTVTAVGNFLLSHDGVTVLFYVNDNAMTLEALIFGLMAGWMIAAVMLWFGCMQSVFGSDKVLYLLGNAAPAVALTFSMILRFLPTLRRRFDVIRQAQKAMGRHGDAAPGGRLRQQTKEFSILISWSLENAIDTADAMEARGYGLHPRTNFHLYEFRFRDGWQLALLAVLAACSVAALRAGYSKNYYYPSVAFPAVRGQDIIWYGGYVVFMAVPLLAELRGAWHGIIEME